MTVEAVAEMVVTWLPTADRTGMRMVRAAVTDAHGRVWSLTGDQVAGLTAYDLWARTRLAQARAVEECPRP